MGCVSSKDAKKHGLTVMEKKDREKPLARQKKPETSEPVVEDVEQNDAVQEKEKSPSKGDNEKELQEGGSDSISPDII